MAIAFVTEEGPVSPEALAELERSIAQALPLQYREFLLHRNGGRPDANVSELSAAKMLGVSVTAFFGIARRDGLDLERARQRYRDRLLEYLLPVAEAEGGNLICLSLGKADHGAVYFWDHEKDVSDGHAPSPQSASKIAQAFDIFLDSLSPLPKDVRPAGARVLPGGWVNPEFLAKVRHAQSKEPKK